VTNTCQNAFVSNPFGIALNRTPNVVITPPPGFLGALCGFIAPITFNVPTIPCATAYSWTIPAGWSGSSTTNSITLTPNGTSAGTLTVQIPLSTGLTINKSLVINFVNQVPTPTITAGPPTGAMCVGDAITFTCNPPHGYTNDFGFDWHTTGGLLVNGVSATSSAPYHSTTNSVTVSVSTETSLGSNNIFVKLNNYSCAPSPVDGVLKWVGIVNSTQFSISGPSSICPNSTQSFLSTFIDPMITEYLWGWGGVTYQSGQGTPYLGVYVPYDFQNGSVVLRIRNRCGLTGSPAYKYLSTGYSCGGYYISFAPNPASEELIVSSQRIKSESGQNAEPMLSKNANLALLTEKLEVVRSGGLLENGQLHWDVSTLPNGLYYLRITTDVGMYLKRVLVKHK
jgi:hypothetical protein